VGPQEVEVEARPGEATEVEAAEGDRHEEEEERQG